MSACIIDTEEVTRFSPLEVGACPKVGRGGPAEPPPPPAAAHCGFDRHGAAGLLLWLLLTASMSPAALPPDAVVLAPETMTITGEGWEVRENFDGWFKGWTTGNKCLYGALAGEGEATATLTCPADGVYRIWVRYLDLGRQQRKGVNSFLVEALQEKRPDDPIELDLDVPPPAGDGAMLALDLAADARPLEKRNTKEFDMFGLRIGEAGEAKWGDSFAAFVWDSMEAKLRKGDYTLRISKTHPRRTERHQRLIDCIIITSDETYEAQTEDLTPLYVRFDVPAVRTNALRFLLRSRLADGGNFFEHVSFSTPFVKPVKPGASSEWIEVSKYLKAGKLGQYNRVTFDGFVNKRGETLDADYTVHLSRSPSTNGIVKTLERRGRGSSVSFRIDLLNREAILSEIEESAANLVRSQATPAVGRYPTQFVFQTSCAVSDALEQTWRNEMQALRNLGINQIAYPPDAAERYARQGFTRAKVGFYIWNLKNRPENSTASECYLNPDREKIARAAEEAEQKARQYPPGIEVVRLAGFADEPGFDYLAHVPECPLCQAAFPGYLKAMNVPYEVFAREVEELALEQVLAGEAPATGAARSLDAVRPSADTNRPHHFYWTSRFGINTVTEFIRTGTQAAETNNPAWRTTLNFANQLRSTLAGSGLDWFEIFRTRAMTFGENEDYIAWVKNFQLRGYLMAVMRAACKTQGYAYGPLAAYPGNTGWELVAGGFSQIGQGATFFSFFNYGPHYVPSSSPCSHLPWVHDATRHLTYATGAVEDRLYGARVMTGDVATLLSTTSDIWSVAPAQSSQTFANLYGMERFYLYLILRHLQASVDVLAEEDLATDLKPYRMLLATDSHLRRAYAPAVREWVEAGGTLYVGANALAFDEYNQPLGLIEGMGLARGLLANDGNLNPGRPQYELNHRRSLGLVQTPEPFNAIFGTQSLAGGETLFTRDDGTPALIEVAFGRGRVIAGCTFPAMEYIKTSDWDTELPIRSTVRFNSGPRAFIGRALERGGVVPRASCSNLFLEANLLENGRHVIVALANWSGTEQEATVTFRGLGRVAEVQAVRTPIRIVGKTDDELVVAGRFGPGDFLTILR